MHLFKGTRYWKPQCLGIAGLVLLLLALNGPLLQYPTMPGFLGIPRASNGPSMLNSPDILIKLGAFVVLGLGVGAMWALFNLQLELLKRLTLGILILSLTITIAGIKNIDVYDHLTIQSLIPVYFPAGQQVALGWAWVALLAAPWFLWLSATTIREPSHDERIRLMSQTAPALASATSVASSIKIPGRLQPGLLQPKTVASETGTCTKCKARNSTRSTRCHQCGATLPWEEARINKAVEKDKAKAATAKNSSGGFDVGQVALTLLFGSLVLCFAFIPFIGYFFWLYLNNEDSKYAGVALTGVILSLLYFVGGYLLNILLAMAKVGGAI